MALRVVSEDWKDEIRLLDNRFSCQNPGFDFSGAELKKGYDKVPDSLIEKWAEKQHAIQEKEIQAKLEETKEAVTENVKKS